MFINITDSKEAASNGSSSGVLHYLKKENRIYNKDEPEIWFSGQQVRMDLMMFRKSASSICK
jgi:hypothetical protein